MSKLFPQQLWTVACQATQDLMEKLLPVWQHLIV